MVDHDVAPGVTSDEGAGDAWPAIRRRMLDAEILVVGTPIWLGRPSSVCKRVLERLNAMMTEEGDDGRRVAVDRIAGVAVVGNEVGAHHGCAEVSRASPTCCTLRGAGATYWTDETSTLRDEKEMDETPEIAWSTSGRRPPRPPGRGAWSGRIPSRDARLAGSRSRADILAPGPLAQLVEQGTF